MLTFFDQSAAAVAEAFPAVSGVGKASEGRECGGEEEGELKHFVRGATAEEVYRKMIGRM